MLTLAPRGDLARHPRRRVDHDGDLLLPGLELRPGDEHVRLEQRALLEGGQRDLVLERAEVTDGGVRQPALGHRDLLELPGRQRAVRRDVTLHAVGHDLGPDLGVDVADHHDHPGERREGAQDREEQQDDAAALA
ncbi:hypothetical protein GCM10020254_34180 [Streptomyces goshikiensis]